MALDPFEVDGMQAGGPDTSLSGADILKAGGDIFSAVQGGINAASPYAGLALSYASADRKSTRLNSSHVSESRMPSSA